MIWILPEIPSGETKRIEYTVLTSGEGGYASTVHVDAFAISGTGYDSSEAATFVMVNRTGLSSKSFRYGGWEPPAWNLDRSGEESFESLIDSFDQEETEEKEG